MVRATATSTLAQYVFDGAGADPLADEVAGWLAGSARFRAFTLAHRDKVRKKLRGAMETEARRDVRAELRVAHLLLSDRRIQLAFEAHGSARGGPDFNVTFRGQRTFNLEVTRLHRTPDAVVHGGPLLAKLRQMPPSAPNALLVAIEGVGARAFDVDAATRGLRTRADARDEEFFVIRGFKGTREFYQRYLRLGAVLVWCEGASGDDRAVLWSNRSARIAVPERAAQACVTCLRAGR